MTKYNMQRDPVSPIYQDDQKEYSRINYRVCKISLVFET